MDNESNHSESSIVSTPNLRKQLFNVRNVLDTFHCLVKSRPNHVRLQIFFMFAIIFLHVTVVFGVEDILLQFCEKVFHWNVASYSNFFVLVKLFPTFILTFFSYVFVKYFSIQEGTLLIISQVSEFLGHILVGTFLKPLYYYISIPVSKWTLFSDYLQMFVTLLRFNLGSLSGLATIGVRTRLSKLISKNELGKIFSLYTSLEAFLPFIASYIYSNIFTHSISTYPGLVYQFSAFISLTTLIVILTEEAFFNSWSLSVSTN